MKREFSPGYFALVLVMVCVIFRVLASRYPHLVPNISPMMAVAFVGAMYLPRAWGWLVGPVALVVTEIAFIPLNEHAGSPMISWGAAVFLAFYAAAGGLGLSISRNKSLTKVIAGSLILSLFFYVVANTFAWAGGAATASNPGYARTLAGWWQAQTVGLPGWEPTWHFLRNGMAGDLFFVFILLAVLDRGLLLGWSGPRATVRAS